MAVMNEKEYELLVYIRDHEKLERRNIEAASSDKDVARRFDSLNQMGFLVHVYIPNQSDMGCAITGDGKDAIEDYENERRTAAKKEHKDNVRYWVGTAIAVVTLILTIISVLYQIGWLTIPVP